MAVFNLEGGQLALGSKTPVSILQEIMHKKGISPHYELIYNGVGTPEPRFKFQVSAEGVSAVGDGKSKKEAKHDAAATLLKRLMMSKGDAETKESTEEVDIASPYTGALKTNYVGLLEEIIFVNKIPAPNYVLVLEEGPPHARVFTMKCEISSISEIAVARTKKQAKHLVAQKMVERVKEILKEKFIAGFDDEDTSEDIVTDREKIRNGTFRHDLTHKVSDLHNVFHLRNDEQPLPSLLLELAQKSEEFIELMAKPLEYLEEVVEALEGVVKTNYFSRGEFESSLRELVISFESDWFEDEDQNESEDESYVSNGVSKITNLSHATLSDDKENCNISKIVSDESNCDRREGLSLASETIVDGKQEGLNKDGVDICYLPDYPLSDDEEERKTEKIVSEKPGSASKEATNTSLVEDFAGVYSFVKVEVPMGLWDFVGKGKSDQEALERAARNALLFLKVMAIPPPANCS